MVRAAADKRLFIGLHRTYMCLTGRDDCEENMIHNWSWWNLPIGVLPEAVKGSVPGDVADARLNQDKGGQERGSQIMITR